MEPPISELSTVRNCLRWAEARFSEENLVFGHGCDNAHDEAAWLILHALNQSHDHFDEILDVPLNTGQRESVLKLLNQRISQRIPSAYLTHQAWLGGHDFYVDERVIVPRSYFAELLENALSPWLPENGPIAHALDLCTGSGCLAILMALNFPTAKIDAIDISPDALDVAGLNIERYEMNDCIELIKSDLFSALAGRHYELILSNPPYVTTAAMNALPAEYCHEPTLALAAGNDGLDIVRRILRDAAEYLSPQGVLMVEVGHNASLVEAAFPRVPFTWVDTPSSEEKIFMLTRQELTRFVLAD